MTRSCGLWDLGLVPYEVAWALQRSLVAKRLADAIPDVLLLLEHPPVYTVGRRGSPEGLAALGLPVYAVERGGDVTYHGPGQLVGYPIFSLPQGKLDVKRYVHDLEEVLLNALLPFGVQAQRGPHSGVWIGEKKLASIGVAVKHHVTYHGFALNVTPDLRPFRAIRPCGLEGSQITSMSEVVGKPIPLAAVKAEVVRQFTSVFDREMVTMDTPEVDEALVLEDTIRGAKS